MIVAWYVLLCYMFVLPFFLIGIGEHLLAFSFYVNAVLLGYLARLSLVRNIGGPAFATISIFLILFFYAAPIYQSIEYRGFLINNYTPSLTQMVSANLFVFVFTALFILFYLKRRGVQHRPMLTVDDRQMNAAFPILVLLAVAVALWAVRTMMTSAVEVVDETAAVGIDLANSFKHKVVFVIPFVAIGFYLCQNVRGRSLLLVGALLVCVLLSKNILLDRRNALGPIYLSLLFLLLWQGRIGSRSVFILVGSALLFVFPITAIFINNPPQSWTDLLTVDNVVDEIRNHFVNMHYDAWANLVASIEFVRTEGLQYGRQLLGTVLFFFPRELWMDKPVASGQLLGEYLIFNHGLWFSNISSPLPAEAYLDFGVVGVALFAIALAIYAQRIDYFVANGSAIDKTSALYFAFYLTFVMRGSFLPAVAYGVGAYVALNVIPALLSYTGLRSVTTNSSLAERSASGRA